MIVPEGPWEGLPCRAAPAGAKLVAATWRALPVDPERGLFAGGENPADPGWSRVAGAASARPTPGAPGRWLARPWFAWPAALAALALGAWTRGLDGASGG